MGRRNSFKKGQRPPRDFSLFHERIFPFLNQLIRSGYFSLEVRGLHHLPSRGGMILAGNHSGWFTLDSLMVALAIYETVGEKRLPYAIINDSLLEAPLVGQIFKNLGVVPMSWLKDIENLHPSLKTFGIFPEGEAGICKPFWRAYQMARWKTGFVRLAIARKAQVVPMSIIGGEECLPTSLPIKFLRPLIGSSVPVPLLSFPLPTSWKVIFQEPIDFSSYGEKERNDRVFCEKMASRIRSIVQLNLDFHTDNRPLAQFSRRIEELKSSLPFLGRPKVLPKKVTESPSKRKRRLQAII